METIELKLPEGFSEATQKFQKVLDEIQHLEELIEASLAARRLGVKAADFLQQQMRALLKDSNPEAFAKATSEEFAVAMRKDGKTAHIIICEVGESVHDTHVRAEFERIADGGGVTEIHMPHPSKEEPSSDTLH